MQRKRLEEILNQLKNIRIAVIGDYFLDKYLLIDSALDETSLETGLTAYQVTQKMLMPGAAGTITNNLFALGVGSLSAVGVIGLDGEGFELREALENRHVDTKYLISSKEIFTPTYIKPVIISEQRELNRLDIRNRKAMPAELEKTVMKNAEAVIEPVDAVIILDQVVEENLGIITQNMRTMFSSLDASCDKIIYADSRAHLNKFSNIIVKCNNIEAAQMTGIASENAREIGQIKACALQISEKNGKCAFVTCGDIGIVSAEKGKAHLAPAVKVEGKIDICGAGDASTAAIVSALCCGASAHEAAQLANIVSSITIRQIGVTGTASPNQILEVFDSLPKDADA